MLGSLSYGRWLHGRIPGSGLATNVQLGTAIVNMYAKCGALKCAGQVFDRMLLRNVWTWSAMILGLAQHGLARNAIELFDEMKHAFVELNYVTFLGVISACSHAGLVDVGLRLFHEMVEQHGIKLRMSHCSAMVYLLGRNGHLQEAYNFVQRMPIEPDAVVWRTLLSTCQLHPEKDETGIGQEAKRRLLELEPRRVGNYVMAVNMYSDQGSWDEAARVRRRMREEGLRKAPGESCIEVGGGMHRFISGDNYCNNGYETIITLIVIMVKEAMVRLQWSILPRYLKRDINIGLLYYLQTDQTRVKCYVITNYGGLGVVLHTNVLIGCQSSTIDLVGLIMHRNELATDVLKASRTRHLPSMLQNLALCKVCRHLNICTIFHKAYGGDSNNSGLGDFFDDLAGHLTVSHSNFLKHWVRLVDLEAQASKVNKKERFSSRTPWHENSTRSSSYILVDFTNEFSGSNSSRNDRFKYCFVLNEQKAQDQYDFSELRMSDHGSTLKRGDHGMVPHLGEDLQLLQIHHALKVIEIQICEST